MTDVLTTERLTLRPVTAADHAGLLGHWTAPDVRRFLFDGAVLSAAEITDVIEDSARSFAAAGYGLWLIRERDGSDLVGTAGLRPGLPEVLAEVDEGNEASVKVIQRLGMTRFAVVPGLLGPMARYRRAR